MLPDYAQLFNVYFNLIYPGIQGWRVFPSMLSDSRCAVQFYRLEYQFSLKFELAAQNANSCWAVRLNIASTVNFYQCKTCFNTVKMQFIICLLIHNYYHNSCSWMVVYKWHVSGESNRLSKVLSTLSEFKLSGLPHLIQQEEKYT
jgi:hypothetical protein